MTAPRIPGRPARGRSAASPCRRSTDLPDDIRARILEVQEKAGFVPNVFLAFAHRPDEFRAFFAYHDALMLKPIGPHQGRAGDDRRRHQRRQPLPVLRRRARRDPAHLREEPARRRPGRGQLPQGRHHAAPEGDARLRDEGRAATRARSATPTSRRCARTASATRTPGTSPPSRPSSACRTGWPTRPRCGRTTSST